MWFFLRNKAGGEDTTEIPIIKVINADKSMRMSLCYPEFTPGHEENSGFVFHKPFVVFV